MSGPLVEPGNMMIVRPRNCIYCGHGYYGLQHVVQYAQQIGAWDVTDLTHEQANKDPIYEAIDLTDPGSFYGFGHGNDCYAEDTQVLTEKGWKYFYDLKDERVATLNPTTDKLEYQKPTRYISYFYSGKMFYQKGRAIDLLVTPNHNLWISWECSEGKEYKPYQFLKPSELRDGSKRDSKGRFISTNYTNGNLKFKRSALWGGEEQEYFILPAIKKKIRNQYGYESEYDVAERKIPIDDWMEFFGYWISEGCACLGFADKNKKYINYRVSITQNDDENREKIKKNLDKIGIKYHESGNGHSMNLELRNKQLYLYLKQFGHAKDKFIPIEIKKLPRKQLKILFDALILGDGTSYGTSYRYNTSSKQLADDVQEIALKIGFAAVINKPSHIYHISIATKDNLNPLCMKRAREFIEYEGMVYCVEVPNHIIYIRRNGKPVWCGNCIFTGDAEQGIFTCNECEKLSGRVVYLLSCLTANGLGPAIMEQGAVAYAGYDISWTWLSESDPDGDNDPYDDAYAKCFWESGNELWIALLDGYDFFEALQQARAMYNEWIEYWLYENPDDPYAEDCIMWLVHDRDGLVGLPSVGCNEYTTEEQCLLAGCNWNDGVCLPKAGGGVPLLAAVAVIAIVGIAYIAYQK